MKALDISIITNVPGLGTALQGRCITYQDNDITKVVADRVFLMEWKETSSLSKQNHQKAVAFDNIMTLLTGEHDKPIV